MTKQKSIAKKLGKIFLWLISAISLLALVLILLYWQTTVVEDGVRSYLNRKLEGQAAISYKSVRGSLLNRIEIEQFSLELQDGLQLQSGFIELKYDLLPLLKKHLVVSRIFIDQLEITLPAGGQQQITSTKTFDLDSTLQAIQKFNLSDTLLALLPDMEINEIEIFANKIILQDQPFTFTDLSLQISKLRTNRESWYLKVDKASAMWQERNLRLKHLGFELRGNHEHLSINQFSAATDRSHIELGLYVNYRDSGAVNLELTDFVISLGDVAKLTDMQELKQGRVQGNLSLSGQPLHFGVTAQLSGSWADHQLQSLALDILYKDAQFRVEKFELAGDNARLSMAGEVSPKSGARGRLKFRRINLMRYSGQLPQTDLNGSLQFDLSNLDLKRPSGRGSFVLQQSLIDSVKIDSVLFALTADRGNLRIFEPSFIKFDRQSRFLLSGTLDRKSNIDLTFFSFDHDLAHLGRAFRIDSLAGRFDVQIRATGKLQDPTLSGNLMAPFARYKTLAFDSVSLKFYTDRILTSRMGELHFNIKNGHLGTVPVSEVSIDATLRKNDVDISNINFISSENYLKAALQVHFSDDEIIFESDNLDLEYQKYWLKNDGPLSITVDSAEINLEQFKLRGPENSGIEIAGFWDNAVNDLQAYLILNKVRLKPFEQFWEKSFNLTGIVNGTAELMTPLHEPNLEIDLRVDSLVYEGVDIGTLRSAYQYANDIFYVQEFFVDQGLSHFEARGDLAFSLKEGTLNVLEDTQADMNVRWNNISLAHYAPLLELKETLKGTLSGYLQVEGNVNRPRLKHALQLRSFQFGTYSVDSLDLFAQYNSGYFLIDSLNTVLEGSRIQAHGWQKYNLVLSDIDTNFTNKPIQFIVSSKGDRISFIGDLNEQLESITGPYEAQIQIGGTLEHPAVTSGYMRLEDGQILLSRVRDPLKNARFEATIEDSLLTINSFSAYSVRQKDLWEKSWRLLQALIPWTKRKVREGYISLAGTVGLQDVLRPRIDLKAQLDELYVDYFVENVALVVSSNNLAISGQDTISVSGNVYIPQAVYEVDLGQMARNVYLTESMVELTPPYTALDLNVEIPGNFVITSSPLDLTNNFKIMIMGELQTILEPRSEEVQISGHMDVVSGKYASWNQNFDVKSGSIDFKNPTTINPDIDMVAAKKIGRRVFELVVSGTLEDMKQDIRVTENGRELDISYLDKITMLTLGADVAQITTQTDSTIRNVGEDVATTSLLTAVERSAEKYTGLDKVEISSNESLLDLKKVRLNNGLRDASISFGKYLTNDLYIEYRTQFGENVPAPRLGWQAGNRLGLQYRLNRNWTFDSYYEKTERGNNKIKIGLNWEVTF